MKDLLIYSTVAGEIPLLVQKNIPKCFVEYEQYLELKDKFEQAKKDHNQFVKLTSETTIKMGGL